MATHADVAPVDLN